jgi:predicted permease
MSLAVTAFNQIAIMFMIILVGVVCYKIKLIDKEMNKKLSDLVLMLINPIVILVSYQRAFDPALLKGLLISLALAMGTHLFAILIGPIFLPKKRDKVDLVLERFAVVYSNCGFMGIPMAYGLFGSEGVFYITAYMTIFNLLVWTHGLIIMTGKSDFKSIGRALLSPSVIATVSGFILFVGRMILPQIVTETLTYLGDMNTPLAMLVAGVSIAQTDIGNLFKKLRIFYVTFLRLLFVPIVMLLLYHWFDLPEVVLLTSILAAACPTAATITLFSLRYDKNYFYASEIFAVTTIFSMGTIPIVMMIANMVI